MRACCEGVDRAAGRGGGGFEEVLCWGGGRDSEYCEDGEDGRRDEDLVVEVVEG